MGAATIATLLVCERDAWSLCLSGEDVSDVSILAGDWPVKYWARLGACLQFAAGLVVLLDLAGIERIRNGKRDSGRRRLGNRLR